MPNLNDLLEDVGAGLQIKAIHISSMRDALTGAQDFEDVAYLGKAYGIAVNKSTGAVRRLGNLAGYAAGVEVPGAMLPIQSKMRRCVMAVDGTVSYYLHEANSALKEDGATAATLTGGDGNVMVEIPKFWYKYVNTDTEQQWWVSPESAAGFDVHPMFSKGGTEQDYAYVGAYPAVLFDASEAVGAGAYVDGTGLDITPAAEDYIGSIKGKKPITYLSRTEFRAAAEVLNDGVTGYHIMSIFDIHAIQVLFITEYANLNSQDVLSPGNTRFTVSFNYTNMIGATGKSDALGNFSGGQSTASGNIGDYMSYRGIEDLWGNVWQWVDGININAYIPYLTADNDPSVFSDTYNDANHSSAGVTLASTSDSYIKKLANTGLLNLPETVGGSSITYYYDNWWVASGARALHVGGTAHNGSNAGVFASHAIYAASFVSAGVGGRLCKI